MRGWFLFFLFFLFFSKNSYADINCKSQISCNTLNDIAKQHNLSLNLILNDINDKIIKIIINDHNEVIARDYSRLNFSLNGLKENNKISFNVGGVISNQNLNSTILNSSFNYNYISGGGRPSLILEIPDKNINLIINASYWNDRADFYITNNDIPNSKDFVFAFGLRYFLTNNKIFNLSFINGFIFGNKIIELQQTGSKFYITIPNGKFSWEGEEHYKQNINFISIPTYLIASAKIYDITIAGIMQYTIVYMNGIANVSKNGAIGPILGKNTFINLNVESENYVKNTLIFPEFGGGIEYEFDRLFFTGVYQKSYDMNLHKASFGIGIIF